MSTVKRQSRIERLLQNIGFGNSKAKDTKKNFPLPPPPSVQGNTGFIIKGLSTILDRLYAPDWESQIDDSDPPVESYVREQSLASLPIEAEYPGKYYSIRLGFVLRFSSTGDDVEISQMIADVARAKGPKIQNVQRFYEVVLRIKEYTIEHLPRKPDNKSIVSAEWYQFKPTLLDGLKSFAGIDESNDQIKIILERKVNIDNVDVNNINPPRLEYTKLEPVNINSPKDYLEFYDPEIELVFFSDADFSLLHGKLALKNKLRNGLSVISELGFDVFFSGAKLNIGRVINPYSQIELVSTNSNNAGYYPSGDDFTLKAEVIQRKILDLDQSVESPSSTTTSGIPIITGAAQPSSYANLMLSTEGPSNEEPADPTNHSVDTDYDSPLPLVMVGLPCPKIWEIDGGGGPP